MLRNIVKNMDKYRGSKTCLQGVPPHGKLGKLQKQSACECLIEF